MSHFPFAAAAALALGLAVTTTGHTADERGPAQAPGPSEGSALPSARTQDEDFLRTAPGLLAPEIEASKLGVEKGRDPQVVALSRSMVESYTELERKLKDAARSAGHEVTDKVDPHGVHRVQRLEDTGPQFDLAFIDEQRGWHKKLVAIYSMEERAGQNEALKKHAEEGRALLAKNLEEIQRLEARLREERTTPGR
jgi:predicted outer membrane protein